MLFIALKYKKLVTEIILNFKMNHIFPIGIITHTTQAISKAHDMIDEN